MSRFTERIKAEVSAYRQHGWEERLPGRQPWHSDSEYLSVLRRDRPDNLPGITVGAVWEGSLVTGYTWQCGLQLLPNAECKPLVPPLLPTEKEAWDLAIAHWYLHADSISKVTKHRLGGQ